MDPVQKRRVQKHQRAIQEAAKRRRQDQKNKNNPKAAAETAAKRNKVKRVLPVPKDIKASEFNNECYIVGGGPSLTKFDWKKLDGKFVIAVNRSYEVLPDAQIVYFTDDDYWSRHTKGMLKHTGKKYRGRLAKRVVIKHPDVLEIQLQPQPSGWSDQFGELYHGSNSGFACIQLAAQLGFTTIYLLGYDMKHRGKYNRGAKNCKGTTHWHNGHRRIDPATAYAMMLRHYQKMVAHAKQRNINIINVNTPKGTDLKCFPIKSFEGVFPS
ncbi:hypothetical protein LCGC14_2394100 [marine sediment metagenome]|uniref:DUF115 domain-containing protein n=1 Tax=marine sediment metagenome TaxID=412755 RepID=A0A0F9E9M2_9ZZZZ